MTKSGQISMNKILLCDYFKLKTQECQNAAARCSCFYFFIILLHVSFLGNQISNALKFQKEASSLGTKVNVKKLTGIQNTSLCVSLKPGPKMLGCFTSWTTLDDRPGVQFLTSVMGGVKSEATGSSGSPSPAPPTLEQPHGSFLKGC